jgi:hypothetical protein
MDRMLKSLNFFSSILFSVILCDSMPIDLKELKAALRACWSKETSAVEDFWSPERPSTGQCGPTSLVVQDFLGGDIAHSIVSSAGKENSNCKQCPKIIECYGSHIYNVFPYGKRVDLTRCQFPDDFVILREEIIERGRVLGFRETERKYLILRERVNERLLKY